MTITRLYQLAKLKKTTPLIFNEFIDNNQMNFDYIKNYKNSWGENILLYAIKYNFNLNFFEHLFRLGLNLDKNFYGMTPIDLCVTYNKNMSHQKFLILDWLYSKNIQFNPDYLLLYSREYINWIRNKDWSYELDISKTNSIGNTPLHNVCKIYHHNYPPNLSSRTEITNNSYDAFYILMEAGANPHKKNNYGLTAIDYCIKNSLINNLNILYHFGYSLTRNEINRLMETNNYYKLIKHTLWLLENYNNLNLKITKEELETKLLTKIMEIQYQVTAYNSDFKTLLEDLSNKVFFDNFYTLRMFKIEGNFFF